jgi:hypothetical protein
MFKPDNNPELSGYEHTNQLLGSLLIFLRETQTNALAKDAAEF